MQVVENEIYYHLQKTPSWQTSHEWDVGNEFEFGRETNAFFSTFERVAYGRPVILNGKKTSFTSLDIYKHLHLEKQGLNPRIPELKDFYLDPSAQIAKLLEETLLASLRYIREIILEEVRKEHFSDLPSRMRCIWLLPPEDRSKEYWLREISSEINAIFKLRVTGKLIRVNISPLRLNNIYTLHQLKNLSKNYWKGVSNSKSIEDEILFEGSVKVLEKMEL